MKSLLVAILLCMCILVSCTPKFEYHHIDLSKYSDLKPFETLIELDDKFPTDIAKKDSIIFIIHRKLNSTMLAYNLNTKKFICDFGYVGKASNEVISPRFITSIDNTDIIIGDVNSKKILKIIEKNIDASRIFDIEPYIEYPLQIYPSGEINLSANFITGRMIGYGINSMFYIYNRNTEKSINCDFYPAVNSPYDIDMNNLCAPCLALNEKKNRIVAGMYFFDMFHLYDLEGKRLKSFCFTENLMLHFNSNEPYQELRERGYSGIVKIFASDDCCYLLRLTKKPLADESDIMIVQINWDGDMIASYQLGNNVLAGTFFVDELINKLYMIRIIEGENNEIYAVTSYLLNQNNEK
jgi:hypothetical protein